MTTYRTVELPDTQLVSDYLSKDGDVVSSISWPVGGPGARPEEVLHQVLSYLDDRTGSRGNSLAITKIQEAIFWLGETA